MPLGVLRSPRRLGTGGPWELGPLGATAWDPWNSWARSHQEPQADPRRLQEAPGGPRKFQEATGGLRRPQEATADPRRSQEATGGPRRPLEVPGAGETHEVPGVVSLGPITQEEPGSLICLLPAHLMLALSHSNNARLRRACMFNNGFTHSQNRQGVTSYSFHALCWRRAVCYRLIAF